MPDSGVKISSLPSAAAEDIQGTDVLAGVSDDATKKFSFMTILTWIKERLSKSDVGLDNVANVLQYSASNPPPYPVTSVNGQTGNVSITIPSPVSPSDASPAMDGTAAAGSSPDFARGDHVHPTDTSRQATINVSGVLAGDGNGGVAAVTVDSSPDTSHTSNLISSAAVAGALTDLESDLAAIHATGTTNTTGAAISSGTYFYLNGTLAQAKADIAIGATFTNGTNYEVVTAGGLNSLKAALDAKATYTQDSLVDLGLAANGVIARTGNIITMYISSPTNPMTQNVSYNVGVLPNRYIPYAAMNGNHFVANGRDYYASIVGGSITLNTPSVLPSTGIPNMQIYITWIAKYAI